MTDNRRKPFWNVASMILQAVAIIAAIATGILFGQPESLIALLYMVPTHAFFSLLGAVAACLALARRERWVPLSLIALTVNGIPFLMMLGLIAQKVRF
ncbi:MAG: hypothetical protein WCK27_29865 [Verrucomicrobiota bacterium]